MTEWFLAVFTGQAMAFTGIFIAVVLCCVGSAKGIGIVGEAGAGLLTEDSDKFPQILILEIIPTTNGIYGFVAGMLVMVKMNLFSGDMILLSFGEGTLVLVSCLPIAIVGYLAAVIQARIVAGVVGVIAKRPEDLGKGILIAVMVEFFTIIALLVSIMLIISLPF